VIPATDKAGTGMPVLDVVVPVYNEERDLGPSIRKLHAYVSEHVPYATVITIADNASRDGTLAVANGLAAELPGVRVVHLDQKGRGRALHATWTKSDARIVSYMDVDLSTDLAAFVPLVEPLVDGRADVAIGSRLARGSRTTRGLKRELISRAYMLILRLALGAKFSDAQCGFKAMRGDLAREIVPRIEDQTWFFDTELLVLAQRARLRLHEVPVTWIDDPDSRVAIVRTALDDLRGVWRLRFGSGRPTS